MVISIVTYGTFAICGRCAPARVYVYVCVYFLQWQMLPLKARSIATLFLTNFGSHHAAAQGQAVTKWTANI